MTLEAAKKNAAVRTSLSEAAMRVFARASR